VKLRHSLGLLSLVLASFSPALVRAEGDATSRALAVQLFDEAEALLQKEQVAEACPKYAESYRLDPQLGVLIYLAECYEKNGQLASAWGSFREAEEIARKRGDVRGDHARERAAALEPHLSYLVVDVPENARVAGLEVLRDGAVVAPVLWGSRAAIDAGKHRVEARAPGYKPWQTEVVVSKEGSATALKVPRLVAAPSTNADGAPAARGASQRIAAIAVGGLGLAAVGAGGFFGLSAQSSYSDSKDLCNEKGFCTQRGTELRDDAKSKALVATIATGAGAAALITAGVLWFTAPKQESPTPSAARRPANDSAWAVAPGPELATWGVGLRRAF
jgi:serine/threonine-protein kinase